MWRLAIGVGWLTEIKDSGVSLGGISLEQMKARRSGGKPVRALLMLAIAASLVSGPPVYAKPKSGHVVGVMRRAPTPPEVQEIRLSKRADLQFGRLVMITNTGGSVVVPARGLASYRNFVSIGASPSPARFEIQGPPHKMVQLQLIFPVSGTYGAEGDAKLEGLSVHADYTPAFRQEGSMVTLKLDSGGLNAITVGGKLTLDSALPGKTNILIPISASLVE